MSASPDSAAVMSLCVRADADRVSLGRGGGICRVASGCGARALGVEILRGERDYPVVGLTCRPGASEPALPAGRVRERIGPGIPIYVIEPRQTRELLALLPDLLGVYHGAARVWWPGVDEDSQPSRHPLILYRTGVYGEHALQRLARELDAPGSVEVSPEQTAAVWARTAARISETTPPRRSRDAPSHAGAGAAPLSLVASPRDLRYLLGELRRGDRAYPVLVLSSGEGAGEAFPPHALRALDPSVVVYILGNPRISRRLADKLAPHLRVEGGDARIFWAAVSESSSAADHPLVALHAAGDGRDPGERLVSALELSRPLVRRYLAPIQQQLETLQTRATSSQAELRVSRGEHMAAVGRAQAAESRLAALEQQLNALRAAGLDMAELRAVAGMDREGVMHRLIAREWVAKLQAADRRRYPLRAYVLGPQFMASVEDRRIAVPPARVAFVCAMLASGRAGELPGLEPHPYREGKTSASGNDPQAVRADGGKAWMCNLGHGRGAPRLIYWVLPDRTIEFDTLRNHDSIGRP